MEGEDLRKVRLKQELTLMSVNCWTNQSKNTLEEAVGLWTLLPPLSFLHPSPSAVLCAIRLPSAKNLWNVGLQCSDKVCFVPAVP